MRYYVKYESDRPQQFEYIKDAAEAWVSYPGECRVYDREVGREIDKVTLESVLGYCKPVPCKLRPRSRIAYMY